MIERKTIEKHNQYMSTFGIEIFHSCSNCDCNIRTNNLLRVRIISDKPLESDDIAHFQQYKELIIPFDIANEEYVQLHIHRCGSLSIISDTLINVPLNDDSNITMEDYMSSTDYRHVVRYVGQALVINNGHDLFYNFPDGCPECDSTDYISEGYMQISAPYASVSDYERSVVFNKNDITVSIGNVSVYIDALPIHVEDITTYSDFSIAPAIDFNSDTGKEIGEGFMSSNMYYYDDFIRRNDD